MNNAPPCQPLLEDPGTSYWLKAAIAALSARDPVDAANDVEVLAALFQGDPAVHADIAVAVRSARPRGGGQRLGRGGTGLAMLLGGTREPSTP